MPQQWVTVGPVPIEEVERMNVVMICPQQKAGFAQQNPYAMEMDRSNRNYYSCGGFGHLARNCRNKRIENKIEKRRRLEYGGNGNNEQSNLKEKENLIVFD